jgi:hypothetical protein
VIAVLTHPRPGPSYLAATLASTDESAQGRRIVVTDSPALPCAWKVDAFKRPDTVTPDNRWTLWRAFNLAYECGEDLIAVEDDVQWCKSGARAAEMLAVPHDVAWVSLFDVGAGPVMPHGLWTSRNAGGFMFAQAIKFPLRTCALMRRMGCDLYDRVGSDSQLAALGGMLGLSYAIHVPSLVQHVGAVSSVGNVGLEGRTSPSWRADFDPSTMRGR